MLAKWLPVDQTGMGSGLSRFRESIEDLYENGLLPPADIYVSDRDVTVEVAVSGAKPDSFQIAVTANTVTVAGEIPPALDLGTLEYQGIRRGAFHISLTLPVSVDPAGAKAVYRDGMLRLRLVKAAVTAPQLVPVRYDAGGSETEEDGRQRETVPLHRS